MLLQCLLLVLASFALEPTSYENTIYRFTLDQMGTENDVEEFRKSLTKELGQNATVQMSTRFREGKLHRLNLRLTNKQVGYAMLLQNETFSRNFIKIPLCPLDFCLG